MLRCYEMCNDFAIQCFDKNLIYTLSILSNSVADKSENTGIALLH